MYPSLQGNNIGALLRLITEEKSRSPIVPPSADPSSPMRAAVQQPLEAPESPGANRTVSIRPEMDSINAPETETGQVAPMRSRVGPISIGGAPIVVGPRIAAPPVMPSMGPQTQPSSPQVPVSAAPSMPTSSPQSPSPTLSGISNVVTASQAGLLRNQQMQRDLERLGGNIGAAEKTAAEAQNILNKQGEVLGASRSSQQQALIDRTPTVRPTAKPTPASAPKSEPKKSQNNVQQILKNLATKIFGFRL